MLFSLKVCLYLTGLYGVFAAGAYYQLILAQICQVRLNVDIEGIHEAVLRYYKIRTKSRPRNIR